MKKRGAGARGRDAAAGLVRIESRRTPQGPNAPPLNRFIQRVWWVGIFIGGSWVRWGGGSLTPEGAATQARDYRCWIRTSALTRSRGKARSR